MAINCPYCDHRIHLKSPKPGRYRPKCPACARAFLLWVPAEAGTSCQVRGLNTETEVRDPQAAISQKSPAAFVLATPSGGDSGDSSSEQSSAAKSQGFGMARTNPDPERGGSAERSGVPDSDEFIPPRTEVRGYEIERELGRGGMGTVYLARQLSLDRPVALKVMSKRWANDPVFVARFTREAYAAAQLSHPNIVQIHDIGEVDGSRFFSMEYVPGKSLADVVRTQGKLDPETAVSYVLQAARGLKHAHDRGMIHRDVKPDNMLLDDQGLVKVADLGLVKTPATTPGDDRLEKKSSSSPLLLLPADMTGARIALGTPAYMSPEQCRDAATVDHRADIYSLGCTLYVLVTGRPPFDGTTAVELMTKHAYDPLVPPEQIVSRVPKELSAVILRMMEKSPDDRFQTMGEVVRTLEGWLGVHHAGTFSPREEQISKLEGYVLQFNTCVSAILRGRLIAGF
ncbi:MAG: serine/threonine protein kinase, partial [Planctomycetia bacterium]|nr:serine/threonine protein kinase [Planctomycetia bacterium]